MVQSDNVLVGTGADGKPIVTGVLDFEFTAYDWRVRGRGGVGWGVERRRMRPGPA